MCAQRAKPRAEAWERRLYLPAYRYAEAAHLVPKSTRCAITVDVALEDWSTRCDVMCSTSSSPAVLEPATCRNYLRVFGQWYSVNVLTP